MDLHCHLLWGIDDGPRDEAEALALARRIVAAGIGTVCATPHHSPRYPTTPEQIRSRARQLRAGLSREHIPLEVHTGAEVAFAAVAALTDRDLRGFALAGGSWLLIEPPFRARLDLGPIVTRLEKLSLGALIAHPERIEFFQDDPGRVVPLLVRGCRLQVTAGSLLGRHGPRARACAEEICRIDPGVILATDAHASARRAPDVLVPSLTELARVRNVNVRRARRHTREIPAALIARTALPARPR